MWEAATEGAVYRPEELMVPAFAFPFRTLSTYHKTLVGLIPVKSTLNCRVDDGRMQGEYGETITVGPGGPAMPVPCRGTFRGLPGALSVITRADVRLPEACGRKVICTVQVAPAASVPVPPLPTQSVVNG